MTNSHAFDAKPYLMMRWSDNNVDGVNCWGVVREFYMREMTKAPFGVVRKILKSEFGISLPEFQISADNIRAIIRESESAGELSNWTRTESPEFGDVCQLTQSTKAQHYAVYVGYGKYLHAQSGFSPVVTDAQGLADAGYRILHTWRRTHA